MNRVCWIGIIYSSGCVRCQVTKHTHVRSCFLIWVSTFVLGICNTNKFLKGDSLFLWSNIPNKTRKNSTKVSMCDIITLFPCDIFHTSQESDKDSNNAVYFFFLISPKEYEKFTNSLFRTVNNVTPKKKCEYISTDTSSHKSISSQYTPIEEVFAHSLWSIRTTIHLPAMNVLFR